MSLRGAGAHDPFSRRIAARARRRGIRLFITGASQAVRRELITHGVSPPRARFRETVERAVADIKAKAAEGAAAVSAQAATRSDDVAAS